MTSITLSSRGLRYFDRTKTEVSREQALLILGRITGVLKAPMALAVLEAAALRYGAAEKTEGRFPALSLRKVKSTDETEETETDDSPES